MNYDSYAKLFDRVFPLNGVTLDFLEKEFAGKKEILDLCCGRGLYTNALSQNFHVSGVDLSPGMIRQAEEQFPNIRFSVQDMRCFDGKYQGIFIIGNSLVHLSSREEIGEECRYLYEHLEEPGKLVIQIINYDRIYKYQVHQLPEINRDGIRFVREYALYDEKTVFRSTLEYGDEKYQQSVSLYPLRSGQLLDLLSRSGFTNIQLYGGFNRQEFSPDSSMQLVVTAEKCG